MDCARSCQNDIAIRHIPSTPHLSTPSCFPAPLSLLFFLLYLPFPFPFPFTCPFTILSARLSFSLYRLPLSHPTASLSPYPLATIADSFHNTTSPLSASASLLF